ncbi:hypothetical protein [Crocosphaera chwakensis]|uniref:Uncharacterized protein n=1 Tax=Crocosphaera chwakensis CCY0110 TaxID=391612 RepID=A3IY10_9CHRO|nr:hypothetical protein [Crocosphaera chwakensis]EAZ88638.1 hypothetical protein CY0110_12497 [Crocosphaera chwakensis CCY0110]
MFPFFPFWGNPCCGYETTSDKEYKERKLKFLKMMRDSLETRLAGVDAAIETIERQISQDR